MPLIKKNLEPRFENERVSFRDLDALVEGLNGATEESRRWAARDLAEYPDAVLPLISHLQAEPSRIVREAIFTSLLRIGTSAAHESLVRLLRSEDAEIRNSAMEVLKNQTPEVEPLIERLLTDIDPDVRIFAVSIIGSLSCEQVPALLNRVVANDLNINVCCAAIEVLAEVGTADCVPSLESARDRFSLVAYVSFAVDSAISSIRSRD